MWNVSLLSTMNDDESKNLLTGGRMYDLLSNFLQEAPSVTLPTTNPGLLSGRPATSHLSHGTACLKVDAWHIHS
jgi:hypothetical protein